MESVWALASTYIRLALHLFLATMFFLSATIQRRRLLALRCISLGVLMLASALIPFFDFVLGLPPEVSLAYRTWVLPVPLGVAAAIVMLSLLREGRGRFTEGKTRSK